ncbi:glutathione S-transferase [Novosphingobium kunmingense]|uniref:Glutathione S-transferase n=1 Tax=Novosphingobium kunmingense TaxID=1211806 RepID=A0A2N0H398_9SPHN|nr:glutathione S-transferase family protein [Novosphingobium kunmingense]PKB13397.1 glutathione S-transferase [Novosphingobium kunmingense]
MAEIILHQYDTSPFSEKVRLCLGIKGLAWRAVDQPVVMPKPDLVPLTGGYRRIPVLQIGADVYCDSALIVREIDRRFAGPPLYPKGCEGFTGTVEFWADKGLFQAAVIAIFGALGDAVDPAFIKDREALSGQPFNVAAMKAMVPHALSQIHAHAALLARQLDDDRPFLAGEVPSLADAAAFYNFWFIRSFSPGVADSFPALPQIDAWYDRVSAIGHGQRSAMSRDEALEVARTCEPEALGVVEGDRGLVGIPVTLSATDYGRDPIAGVFAGSTAYSMTVLRDDPQLGRIAVHVPRLGYALNAG